MPDSVARFTISIPPDLLTTFDEVIARKGYASRSEGIRDAIRDYLVAHDWAEDGVEGDEQGEVVGTVTLVYEQETQQLAEELLEWQRFEHQRVLSTLRVFMDERNCLEVVVVRGTPEQVALLADALISLRGVKFGRLVYATTGSALT
jgi:CopG family transcriptional regulator, nickel-responsive regulator